MHVVCGVCGFWVMKGLSGLLSRLGENHLHLTSSESHAKPLCYLSSNDGLSYKHTAVYFFLHWNVQIGLGMGAHKGQYKPSFQLGHWLPTSRNLPISRICQHHWLGFSAEATQLSRLCSWIWKAACSPTPQRLLLQWGFPAGAEVSDAQWSSPTWDVSGP